MQASNLVLVQVCVSFQKFQELESSHLEGMKEYLDQYVDVIEEGLSYDYQVCNSFLQPRYNRFPKMYTVITACCFHS